MGRQSSCLETRSLDMEYISGLPVLKDLNVTFVSGQIHGLVGENGAGKSTLFKILSGLLRPTRGTLYKNGQQYAPKNPSEANASGVALIPQELTVVRSLSVGENIYMGRLEQFKERGRLSFSALQAAAQKWLDQVGLSVSPNASAATLEPDACKLVDIGRALSSKPDFLLVDEATAYLNARQSQRLKSILQELAKGGVGIVYISHRLDEIYDICDTVTILKDGKLVGTFETDLLEPEEMKKLMVGRDTLWVRQTASPRTEGPPLMTVSDLSVHGGIKGLNFSLHAGEILAFAGLDGSGVETIPTVLSGQRKPSSGEIKIQGKSIGHYDTTTRHQLGLMYLPKERDSEGVIASFSITENIGLSMMNASASLFSLWDGRKERQTADHLVEDYGIKCSSIKDRVASLSGGNRQKLAMARALVPDGKVIILDNPTRGVDVGAKVDIYQLIERESARGMGILLFSEELTEILSLADRIIVVKDGNVVAELVNHNVTEHDLAMLML